MPEQKMKPTQKDVEAFLRGIANQVRRADGFALLEMMKEVTQLAPVMWGESMVGFGEFHYKYPTGHEGDTFLAGFSPLKQNLSIYINPGFDKYQAYLDKLGKHKTGKVCLYVNKLADVDLAVLKELIAQSFQDMQEMAGKTAKQ